ncbi:ABC transporter permease [Glycomyces buryatensis]|uniref:Xylose transport system permease protein XylH n=1 Tax=Glycomyces buryatensis TaxID=2570927 RepID=A0A4S8QD06_9ACTN|nr:ABC transporter permease [Glycomyces buryatensis]THV42248.1 ABC transporter permease [Glycomyces buryatensis]
MAATDSSPQTAEPAAPSVASGIDNRAARFTQRSLARRIITRPEIGSLLGAIAVMVLFLAVAAPIRNLDAAATVLYATSTIGIMAAAVSLLMIGGEFDLSAGVAVISSALAGGMFTWWFGVNVWVGVLFALAFALAIGFINGYLVTKTKLPSFLITLGAFLILQGLNLFVTRVVTGAVSSPSISNMDGFDSAKAVFASTINIGGVGIRVAILWWIGFTVIATWILLRTKIGNWIYAIGDDQDAARAVGVPVKWTKIGLFMTVGFMAWFMGMHNLFLFSSIQSGGGVGQELIYIAAAVVGGCALMGGYGTAIGTAIGALIFGLTNQGIVFAGWNPDLFKFFIGATLLVAVVLNMWVRVRAQRR